RHLEDLVALLLAAREALVDRAAEERLIHLQQLHLRLHELHELDGVDVRFVAVLADGVQRRLEEVAVADAGDLDRVLEGEEDAFAGALLGIEVEQILAVELDGAAGDLVAALAGEDVGERALAGAVRPHDRVHFARTDGEVDALENGLVFDAGLEGGDLAHDDARLTETNRAIPL